MKWKYCILLTTCLIVGLTGQALAKIQIAFVDGFTGDDPNTAKELYRGAELFLTHTPDAAHKLELIPFDNRGNPEETYHVFQLIDQRGIKIVVGISKSDQALVASQFVNQKHILFVTPFATHIKVTKNAPYTFRMCFTDDEQGVALARFARSEFSPRRVLILRNVDLQYSIGLAEKFSTSLKQLDSSITIQELNYVSRDLALPTVQALIKSFKPQIVFIPDHITRSSLLIKAIHPLDPSMIFLGGDGWGGKKVFHAVYSDLSKDIQMYYSTHWHENIGAATNNQFIKLYHTKYPGDPVTSGSALTYDTLQALWSVLQTCHFVANTECLKNALEHIHLQSTTGIVSFDHSHNPRKHIFIIQLNQHGEHQLYKTL